MPIDLKKTGEKMIDSGKKLVTTGKKLQAFANQMQSSSSVLKKNGRFDKSLIKIGNGIKSTSNLLSPIESALRSVSGILKAIIIPTPKVNTKTIKFPVVGKVNFVKSISLTSIKPLAGAANKIESVANNIKNVRTALDTVSNATGDVHNEMPKIQKAMENGASETKGAGDLLIDSGNKIQEAGDLLKTIP